MFKAPSKEEGAQVLIWEADGSFASLTEQKC